MCESIGLEACLEDLSHRNLRLGIQVGNHEEIFAKWDGSSCNDCRVAQRSLTSKTKSWRASAAAAALEALSKAK